MKTDGELTEFEKGMIDRYGTKKYTQSELDRAIEKALSEQRAEVEGEWKAKSLLAARDAFLAGKQAQKAGDGSNVLLNYIIRNVLNLSEGGEDE